MQTTCEVLNNINDTYLKNRMNYIKLGKRYSETTITDELIYRIQESNPVDSVILHGKKESETGADIEWWFWDYKYQVGIGTRIQSKRMYEDGKYYGLNKIVKSYCEKQVDILINKSIKEGMLPLYFFYNFLTEEKELPNYLFGDKYHWTYSFATTIKEVIDIQIDIKGKKSDDTLVISPKDITSEPKGMDSVVDLVCNNSTRVLEALKTFIEFSRKKPPSGLKVKEFKLDRFIKQTKDIPKYVEDMINSNTNRLNSLFYNDVPKFVIVTKADLSGYKIDAIKNGN